MADERYAIGDLADLADVSRRTVRYYVQEGLLPTPLGLGRGNHYDGTHLARLLKVKALQEEGRTLDEIKSILRGKPASVRPEATPQALRAGRAFYRRLELIPGVELHVAAGLALPSAPRLQELAAWCRTHITPSATDEEDSDA